MRESSSSRSDLMPMKLSVGEEAHIWEMSLKKQNDPTKDEIAGGCFKLGIDCVL